MHLNHDENGLELIWPAKYLPTFFCVLIVIRVDPNRILFLRIAYKQIKLIRTNIYKSLQFIRVNWPKTAPWKALLIDTDYNSRKVTKV